MSFVLLLNELEHGLSVRGQDKEGWPVRDSAALVHLELVVVDDWVVDVISNNCLADHVELSLFGELARVDSNKRDLGEGLEKGF